MTSSAAWIRVAPRIGVIKAMKSASTWRPKESISYLRIKIDLSAVFTSNEPIAGQFDRTVLTRKWVGWSCGSRSATCPSRIFGGARVLCFVQANSAVAVPQAIGQPVGFGRGGGWTDTPVARQPKGDTTVPL